MKLPEVKSTLLDRAISYMAPALGARRLRARAQIAVADCMMGGGWGGYTGGKWGRRQTAAWVTTHGNSADADTIPDLPTLRDRSRDLVRNAPLATGAINTVAQSVVGTGLAPKFTPDAAALGMTPEQAQAWAAETEREFRLWADRSDCDITRTQNFYGLQDLAFRSACECGDVFALLPMVPTPTSPYSTRVQLIEADRVVNPNGVLDGTKLLPDGDNICAGGVEMDLNGAPVAYHIRRFHPGSIVGRTNPASDRYQAFGDRTGRRNVVHLLDRKRVGQTRSAPMLAPVIEQLKMLDKYTEAEVMAAVVQSLFTVFITTPGGEGLGNGLAALSGNAPSAPSAMKGKNLDGETVQMGTGAILDLAPGEKPEFANPLRPNTAFDAFVQSVLRQVGVALGLPFEVLVKHFTASYSAARAALLEAWRFYNNRRVWLAATFCQPVTEAWMDEAVASGRISAPGYFADAGLRHAYQRTEWTGDAPGSIDPLKEAQAADLRMQMHVTSHAEETMALTGGVWEEKFPQMVKEQQMLKDAGMLAAPPATAPGRKPNPDPNPDQQPGQQQNGSDLENN